MEVRAITTKEARYRIISKNKAVMTDIRIKERNLIIHSNFFSCYNYIIVGLKFDLYSNAREKMFDTISFDKASQIEAVGLPLIASCEKTFFLPPKIKRVVSLNRWIKTIPNVVNVKENKFISIIEERTIINHHPHELVCGEIKRNCFRIIETTRIIGTQAFTMNLKIISVVFPPSVEEIGYEAFKCCWNLQSIRFKGKSMLRRIGNRSFLGTRISCIEIPASVLEIGIEAFRACIFLKTITFSKNINLKEIHYATFAGTIIEEITIPSSVESINKGAFLDCEKLKTVKFTEDSHIKKTRECTFIRKPCIVNNHNEIIDQENIEILFLTNVHEFI